MRSFRHWTPRYLFDRVNLLWHEQLHPEAPWLTSQMVEILSCWLKQDDVGLEWGAGRSTVWFAHRVNRLISVEHSRQWHRKVVSALESGGTRNVDLRLEETEAAYAEAALDIAAASLDFCLVDGLTRDRCALVSLPLLKPGGILLLDNCNWYLPSASRSPSSIPSGASPASGLWNDFLKAVSGWRQIWTSSGVTDTALWVKPCR